MIYLEKPSPQLLHLYRDIAALIKELFAEVDNSHVIRFSAQPAESAGSRLLTNIKIKNNPKFSKITQNVQK